MSLFTKNHHVILVGILLSFLTSCKSNEENNGDIILTDTLSVSLPDTTPRIYLTFDDGPYQTTAGILQLLREKKTRANFFIVGSQVDHSAYYDSIFRSIKSDSLFRVYNHSYSHDITYGKIRRYYKDPEAVWNDILRNKQFMPEGSITRLPGKNAWRIDTTKRMSDKETAKVFYILDTAGNQEKIMGWDHEWRMEHSQSMESVNQLLASIEERRSKSNNIKRDAVILLHDYLFKDETALQHLSYLIDQLQAENKWRFAWAYEYPGIQDRIPKIIAVSSSDKTRPSYTEEKENKLNKETSEENTDKLDKEDDVEKKHRKHRRNRSHRH